MSAGPPSIGPLTDRAVALRLQGCGSRSPRLKVVSVTSRGEPRVTVDLPGRRKVVEGFARPSGPDVLSKSSEARGGEGSALALDQRNERTRTTGAQRGCRTQSLVVRARQSSPVACRCLRPTQWWSPLRLSARRDPRASSQCTLGGLCESANEIDEVADEVSSPDATHADLPATLALADLDSDECLVVV